MRTRRELLVRRVGDRVLLLAPSVGWFSQALPRGQVLAPEAAAGVLETLGTWYELDVPAGVLGRIVSQAPERSKEPVEYGQVLYELESIEGGIADLVVEEAESAGGPTVRAPFAGRFWHRASPSDPAFVEVGDEIAKGRTIGLLEVMKTFSHVHYDGGKGGLPERARVVRLVAADGAEVATGDALLVVEPLGAPIA